MSVFWRYACSASIPNVAALIGRCEQGEVKPSIEMAAAIAEALEVSLDYLVGNTDLLLKKMG